MSSPSDRALLEGVRSGRAAGLVAADGPASVAAELDADAGTVLVAPADLGAGVDPGSVGHRVSIAVGLYIVNNLGSAQAPVKE